MIIPSKWSSLRGRSRLLWNPNTPDNMLVRYQALKAGKANPEVFPAEQDRIRQLAGQRNFVPDPTDEEWAEFVSLCLAAGMTPEEQVR